MNFFRMLWRGDPDGLERAKRAHAEAARKLAESRKNGAAAERLLARNRLTARFFSELERRGHMGGHA